jgi:uncharacterized protein YigE (DUF2233 family)
MQFEGSAFTVCRADAERDEVRLAWKGKNGAPLRNFAALQRELGPDAQRVRFAMNAGMYDRMGAPVGLYVEAGQELRQLNLDSGEGNFHLSPNGVFALDDQGRFSITTSAQFAERDSSPRWATQSGPMLVIAGKLHPKFDVNGSSRLLRNGVGVRDEKTAYFVISQDGVSFGLFARFFRDALSCPNALFLDGVVSSLWDAGAQRQDVRSELGPLVVVYRRAAAPSDAR